MIISRHRSRCPGTPGFILLAAGMFLATSSSAQAQLDPQELLKQVLPGATGGDAGDVADAGERACQRYAEKQGLDVRRIRETHPSGSNNLEVTLSIEDRNDRYDARCIYDSKDQEVRKFEPARASSGSKDVEVSERLAQRAQDACEELAKDRDLDDIDFAETQARGNDTVEIDLRARVRGTRQNFTCFYDDDQRRAVLAE